LLDAPIEDAGVGTIVDYFRSNQLRIEAGEGPDAPFWRVRL